MKRLYYKIINIPEILFFIPNIKNGKIYFGKNSYYLYQHRAKTLALWRGVVHAFFSILITLFFRDTLTEKHFVAYIFMLTFVIFVQEFYFHPKLFGQKSWKSFLDFFSWVIPALLVYYFF